MKLDEGSIFGERIRANELGSGLSGHYIQVWSLNIVIPACRYSSQPGVPFLTKCSQLPCMSSTISRGGFFPPSQAASGLSVVSKANGTSTACGERSRERIRRARVRDRDLERLVVARRRLKCVEPRMRASQALLFSRFHNTSRLRSTTSNFPDSNAMRESPIAAPIRAAPLVRITHEQEP